MSEGTQTAAMIQRYRQRTRLTGSEQGALTRAFIRGPGAARPGHAYPGPMPGRTGAAGGRLPQDNRRMLAPTAKPFALP